MRLDFIMEANTMSPDKYRLPKEKKQMTEQTTNEVTGGKRVKAKFYI